MWTTDNAGKQIGEEGAEVADQSNVNRNVVVDLGGIDLDVNLLGVGRVSFEVAGDAVVEAHAEGDEQIGFLDGMIDPGFAVHAHHAEVERMRSREGADAEQRHGNRN